MARVHLVTHNLERLSRFYADVLGFSAEAREQTIDADEMKLLGLAGSGRRTILRLGSQALAIDQFENPGRPFIDPGNAASPWFQHFALVVPDMQAAYARVRNETAISEGGPCWLPASSGGVCAYKFRDPDLHPLELLQFPAGGVPVRWRDRPAPAGAIAIGIDHSAISVQDADRSAAFYAGWGLAAGDRTVNHGPEQQRLDGLPDVTVDVVPMMPRDPAPHLELLGYRVPHTETGADTRPNDVVATRILWRATAAGLHRDPDGHWHQFRAPAIEP